MSRREEFHIRRVCCILCLVNKGARLQRHHNDRHQLLRRLGGPNHSSRIQTSISLWSRVSGSRIRWVHPYNDPQLTDHRDNHHHHPYTTTAPPARPPVSPLAPFGPSYRRERRPAKEGSTSRFQGVPVLIHLQRRVGYILCSSVHHKWTRVETAAEMAVSRRRDRDESASVIRHLTHMDRRQ